MRPDRELLEDLLLVVLAAGCFAVILTEQTSSNDIAAFGLLGVIVAHLVRSRP